jgi:hypothetical protein
MAANSEKPKIALLTFCVGADYKKAMEPGLESKRAYCNRHGYDFITDGEDVWDRTRPIPWSKFNFILKYLDKYDFIFWSDADVIILNHDVHIETNLLPLLPSNKDILWTMDACNHYNNGHLLIRGRSPWVRDYFERCYAETDLLYHIWWDNAAMIKLFEAGGEDYKHMQTTNLHWLFNAYVFGPNDSANDPTVRLYEHGDFLVHFAGVYDCWNIYRMMLYIQDKYRKGQALDPHLLDAWRKMPPINKEKANASLSTLGIHTN